MPAEQGAKLLLRCKLLAPLSEWPQSCFIRALSAVVLPGAGFAWL